MKLTNSFSHTFSSGNDSADTIYQQALNIEGVNGIYLSDYHLVKEERVIWYDLLNTTNYLYSTLNSNITINSSDAYFNNHPSIDFPDSGTEALYFKTPLTIGTLLIVYLTRTATSYLIQAPRSVPVSSEALYYDLFPRGLNGSYFAQEINTPTNLAYNSTLRINSRMTSAASSVVLNSPKLLSLSNLGNNNLTARINGFGGAIGSVGGGTPHALSNSVQGRIAAVITFDRNIATEDLAELESIIATSYLNYQGPISISNPTLRYFADALISFDFSEVIKDEFYDITSYELLYPEYESLVINNAGVLSGTVPEEIYTDLVIRVNNSQNITKTFTYSLEIVIADEIITSLPYSNDLVTVFTAKRGVITYPNTVNIAKLEDARRILDDLPILEASESNLSTYLETTDQEYIVSNGNDSLLSANTHSAKTFAWVYMQTSIGYRNLLNTFPDIRGTGVLWTVNNPSETHGIAGCTVLSAYINTINRNTLSYKLQLNRIYIIVASSNTALSYNGFSRLKGKLLYFSSWNRQFTTQEITDLSYLLGQAYILNSAPFVIDNNTEYRNVANVTVNLATKIIDWQQDVLTYDLLEAPLDTQVVNNQLSFTATTDARIPISVDCTDESTLTTNLSFNIDVAIRTHPLYLTLRGLLQDSDDLFAGLYLITNDTIITNEFNEIDSWLEYRLNGNNLSYINTSTLVTEPSIYTGSNEYNKAISYGSNSYAIFSTPITANVFIIAWIPDNNTSNLEYLFGSSTNNLFKSGTSVLFQGSATSVLNSYKFVNNREVGNTYSPALSVVNIAVIKTTEAVTINSISRNVLDSSVSLKNKLLLLGFIQDTNNNIDIATLQNIYHTIKNYYHAARILLLSNFDSLPIVDSTNLSSSVIASGNLNTQYKKFGNSSYTLINNGIFGYLAYSQKHSNYVLLNEDFTLSFWYASNKQVSEIIPIFNLMSLSIYTYADKLCVGMDYVINNALLTYTLPNNFYANDYPFHLIEIVRDQDNLYLFVNGILIGNADFEYEFKDSTANIFLGRLGSLTDTTVNLYIDALVLYYRTALYTTDHAVTPAPTL